MVLAGLRGGLQAARAAAYSRLHPPNGTFATRHLWGWARASLNTPLLERAPGRRAVSCTITKNSNALRHKRGWRRRPFLSTLDPDRLLPDDLLDLSGSSDPRISFRKMNESGESLRPTAIARLTYKMLSMRRVSSTPEAKGGAKTYISKRCPFPDNTHGFLYFRRSPHPHPDAGEIRFRLVRPGDDDLSPSERFRRGSDLMDYESLAPWRIHALNMIHQHPVLRKKLVEEGFVPQVAGNGSSSKYRSSSKILDSITDPFILHFGNPAPLMTILREESIFIGVVYFGFCNYYHNLGGKGAAWVRFEMANLPCRRNSSGTAPRIVVRVLKTIEAPTLEPPTPTGQIFKEGELIQLHEPRRKLRTAGPWAVTPLFEEKLLTPSARKLLEDTYLGKSVPN